MMVKIRKEYHVNKNKTIGAISLSLAASLWGGMYVVSKAVLDYIPPFTLVWLRYLIALMVLLSMYQRHFKSEKQMILKHWKQLAFIGFVGYFGSISLQFMGTKLSNAHTGSLITSATPAFMVLFAWFLLKEKLTLNKVISVTLATIGVIIVIGFDLQFTQFGLGSILLFLAALTWAYQSILVKLASSTLSILSITTGSIAFALLYTTIPMMIEMPSITSLAEHYWSVVVGVLYLGIFATAGAFFLWNKGLEYLDASHASLFFFFQPLVGSLLGWYFLSEQINYRFFIGAAFILSGVVIINIKKADLRQLKSNDTL